MMLQDVKMLILAVLREVQELSGRTWTGLADGARPIGDLDGFDSLTAIEATVMLEEKLRCKLDLDSVFVSDDGKRALSLKEISQRLAAFVNPKAADV
jgi:acyl carrier protein